MDGVSNIDDAKRELTRVFHRFPKVPMPVATAGDGPYIIDEEGKRYIDASGGAAVSCLGHSNAATIRAITDGCRHTCLRTHQFLHQSLCRETGYGAF